MRYPGQRAQPALTARVTLPPVGAHEDHTTLRVFMDISPLVTRGTLDWPASSADETEALQTPVEGPTAEAERGRCLRLVALGAPQCLRDCLLLDFDER